MAAPFPPLRPIPTYPSLEHDRKAASALRDAARRGDPAALERFQARHPRFTAEIDARAMARSLALHDAQLVIAREYGFASWPRWKQWVELRRLDRAQRAAALVQSACSGDVRRARLLLDTEPDLAAFDLWTACVCGDAEAALRLLARDPAPVHAPGGPLNLPPILYACFSRFLRADPVRSGAIVAIVRALLERGADPNAHFWIESGGERWLQSALYGAAGIANNVVLTTRLLDAGARIDPQDKEVLYHTAEFPDPACLRLLLERGDPPIDRVRHCLARVTDFEYPVHLALFLAAGADPNALCQWDGRRTHLHKAVYLGRSAAIVQALIEAGGDVSAVDDRGVSVFRSAVRNGDPTVIALLKAHGAHDDRVTEADALAGDPITLCVAAGRDDLATIDRLLDGGADINAPSAPDQTPPLHWAAWRGRLQAVRRLVERGADIHGINSYGGNALATTIHGSANCFDTEGGPGMGPHEEAIPGDYPQIVEYLIASGCPLPARIAGGSDAVQDVLRRHGVIDAE